MFLVRSRMINLRIYINPDISKSFQIARASRFVQVLREFSKIACIGNIERTCSQPAASSAVATVPLLQVTGHKQLADEMEFGTPVEKNVPTPGAIIGLPVAAAADMKVGDSPCSRPPYD